MITISNILWLSKVKDSNHTFSKIYNAIRPEYDVRLPMTYDPFAEWLIYAYWNRISPEVTLNDTDDRECRSMLKYIFKEYSSLILKAKHYDIDILFNYKFKTENVFIIEKKCAALMNLINKKKLNHEDRLTLCQIYSNIPEGRARLHQILSNQDNYNHNITDRQITYAKDKKINPPSCKKMREKGYCKGDCYDK